MITATWNILSESALYILIGFGVAGLLQVVISGDAVVRFLSGTKKRSVALATAIGVPLPLCSCSVLPAAMTLRDKGASRGATLAFLISTPETSMTSVMITYALLGPVMAVYRPIAACVTALVAGLAENFVEKRFPTRTPDAQAPATSCCAGESPPPRIDESRSCPSCDTKESGQRAGTRAIVRNLQSAVRYAFVDLFDDIFAWILFGIVTAAVIQVWLPPDLLATVLGGPTQSMLLMVLIGVPLYVCAEASTPIAAAFMLHGMNPGAALVLLLVGPATNIGSLGVLVRHLGRRTVVIYLTTIVVVALVMGGILNGMLASSDINLDMRVMHEPHAPSWLKTVGALFFLGNGLATAGRLRYLQRLATWLSRGLPFAISGRGVGGLLLILAGGLYAASGFFAVRPNEVGVVLRFGAIQRTSVPPGLHYAFPYPFERADRVPAQRVRRLLIGLPNHAAVARTDEAAQGESWTLVGDENIADIKMAVHWAAREGEAVRFQYSMADPQDLVRNVVLGAAREWLGGASINTVFTADRRHYEHGIEQLAQERLDWYDSGIRIHSFHILDAHAPPEVHEAFRDVASALEDRSTEIDRAYGHEAQVIPAARGDAVTSVAAARGYAATTVAGARGEADRFLSLLDVYGAAPDIMRRRLDFETRERVWPKLRKYIKPPEADIGDLEVWLMEPEALRGGG